MKSTTAQQKQQQQQQQQQQQSSDSQHASSRHTHVEQQQVPPSQQQQRPQQPSVAPSALVGSFKGSASQTRPIPPHVLDQEYDMVHQVGAAVVVMWYGSWQDSSPPVSRSEQGGTLMWAGVGRVYL
jgi:hypothetical protein